MARSSGVILYPEMSKDFAITSYDFDAPVFDEKKFEYMCYQCEVCPTTGKIHWQCYARYLNKTAKQFKKILCDLNIEKGHVEKCRGSPKHNRDYCSKDTSSKPGTFKEFGKFPEQGKRYDIREACDAKNLRDIDCEVYVKFSRGIKEYRLLHSKPRTELTESCVMFGPAGCGKSMLCPRDGYWKNPKNKWWCGYDGHEDVIFDDVSEKDFDIGFWMNLLDRYPLTVETKGGTVEFNAKRVWITSNEIVTDWFGGVAKWIRRLTYIGNGYKPY